MATFSLQYKDFVGLIVRIFNQIQIVFIVISIILVWLNDNKFLIYLSRSYFKKNYQYTLKDFFTFKDVKTKIGLKNFDHITKFLDIKNYIKICRKIKLFEKILIDK